MIKKLLLFLILLSILVFVIYDGFVGKKNYPHFYPAPKIFCSQGWAGITLPPLGILLCDADKNNASLKRHEMIHWSQYHRMGSIGFYTTYLWEWIQSGFKYEAIPMEKEANGTKQTAF